MAQMLVELGAEHIDADRVAHRVMAPGGAAYDDVVTAFGPDILRANGSIDRQALGAQVFTDADALTRLEACVHPAVREAVARQIDHSAAPVVVVEAIKLLESGMAEDYDTVWVTTCPREVQRERLMTFRQLPRSEAEQRIDAQPPQEEKIARADVVIETTGTLAETRLQVQAAWRDLGLS